MANGQNNRQVKYPERAKHTVAMAETIIFKINAVGLSVVGKILNRAITAIYPDAPPWPTLEYRIATPKIHVAKTRTAVGLITSIVVFVRQSYLTSMSVYRLALYCCTDSVTWMMVSPCPTVPPFITFANIPSFGITQSPA